MPTIWRLSSIVEKFMLNFIITSLILWLAGSASGVTDIIAADISAGDIDGNIAGDVQ